MSVARQQAFIDAPVERIWELVAQVEHHPEWWPRVAETETEQVVEELVVGDTYRQVTKTPFGSDETRMIIEDLEQCRALSIRCLNTGTFVRFDLTEAQNGTFVDGRMGMEPVGLGNRLFDVLAGRRYFTKWMAETFAGLERAACDADRDSVS